jgi:hypothetical protein
MLLLPVTMIAPVSLDFWVQPRKPETPDKPDRYMVTMIQPCVASVKSRGTTVIIPIDEMQNKDGAGNARAPRP